LKAFISLLLLLFSTAQQDTGEFCGVRNTAFRPGEQVTMEVYYTTLGMYVGAGEAKFTTTLERYNGILVYYCLVTG